MVRLVARVEIGAAAAAGLLRRLVDMHLVAGIGQPHGGGEAGDAGADDVNCFFASDDRVAEQDGDASSLSTRTGSRGAAKPRAISRSRIAR